MPAIRCPVCDAELTEYDEQIAGVCEAHRKKCTNCQLSDGCPFLEAGHSAINCSYWYPVWLHTEPGDWLRRQLHKGGKS